MPFFLSQTCDVYNMKVWTNLCNFLLPINKIICLSIWVLINSMTTQILPYFRNLSIQAYSLRSVLYKRWELWWNAYLLWLRHETWWLKSGYIHNLQFSFEDFLPRTYIELFYMSQAHQKTKILKQNWDDKSIFPACITLFVISKERCLN